MSTNKQTVCYRIFHYGFNVGIRANAVHSDAALAVYNPYGSLGTERAKEALKEIIQVRIPLATIIMYRMDLEPVTFYKYSDMLGAYRLLREHLNNWLTVVNTDYIRKLPPIEELVAMDEMCEDLYPYLVDFYGGDFEETLNVGRSDRIDRLIAVLKPSVSRDAPYVRPATQNVFAKPYDSIVRKILEQRRG